jgi:hypothetical protein
MRLQIVLLSLSHLLTKEDLAKIEPKKSLTYHYVFNDEGEGVEVEKSGHSFIIQAKPLKNGQKQPKYPIRESGFKGSGSWHYKHQISSDKHLITGVKTTYDQSLKEDLSVHQFTGKKGVSLTGTLGYEFALKDGNTLAVYVNADVPVAQKTVRDLRENKEPKDIFSQSSQKGVGANFSISKTF